jgi:hypothetical protein
MLVTGDRGHNHPEKRHFEYENLFIPSEEINGKVKTMAAPRIYVTFLCIPPDYFA